MKRLILISLATILGFGSLADVASAHPGHHRDDHEEYAKPAPPEPIRYRTQLPAEPEVEDEVRYERRVEVEIRVDRYNDDDEYRRERRRSSRHRHRRSQYGTRNDPGRY
jgi:hypothetical protein